MVTQSTKSSTPTLRRIRRRKLYECQSPDPSSHQCLATSPTTRHYSEDATTFATAVACPSEETEASASSVVYLCDAEPTPSCQNDLHHQSKPLPSLPPSQVYYAPLPQKRNSFSPTACSNDKINRLEQSQSNENHPTPPKIKRHSSLPNFRFDNYNQRYTILFFGDTSSNEAHEAPITYPNNRLRAASLSSLVSTITSGDSATSLDLIQAILANFRLFITPNEFFQALKDRFEMVPPLAPQNATHRQHTQISHVRARILAVIYSWLDQHWQVDSDSVVLGRMRIFIEEQCEERYSHEKLNLLLTKIKAREGCSEKDVLDERRRYMATTTPARTAVPDPTNFVLPRTFGAFFDGLAQLDTDDGREELCRHLTMKMSRLFRQLDPIKVVDFWYKQGDSCRKYESFGHVPCVSELAAVSAYGERLTLWVISSILDIRNIKKRVNRVSLWVDVASRCMVHCDYATAHNIYVSLSYSAVVRLKQTILRVPYAVKSKYLKLEDFFHNKQRFRDTFNDLRPSLPCTAPLISSIVHARSLTERDRTRTTNTTSLICFNECKMTQQATRVLNKALMEYKFHENAALSQWLDDRLNEFCTFDKPTVYQRLSEMSEKRESTQTNLRQIRNPWMYYSSNPLRTRLIPMSVTEQAKKATFFAFISALTLG